MSRVETKMMHPKRAESFERVYLYCDNGHEVCSAPATHSAAQRWLAGDFAGESCGYGSCNWEGPSA